MAELGLTLLSLVLIAATVLPLWRRQSWWVRVFDFPRLQIAAGIALALTAHCLWVDSGPFGHALRLALGVCLIQQVRKMLPYTRLARPQVQRSRLAAVSDDSIRLVFANVLQTNRNAQGLLALVRQADPDVFLALETDAWWQAALSEGLGDSYSDQVLQAQDNTYGMVLYSRLPLRDAQVRFLIEDDVPSVHARVRLVSGREIDLHCLHPRPPSPTESDSSAERDAELLIVGRAIKKKPSPVIVMGDMNDVAWSHTSHLFRNISGLLDPRIGRGFFNTFNAKHWFVRYPLDHFFHSNDFRLVDFHRLPYFGSDHFPVYIHLNFEPEAGLEQPEPQADAAEEAESSEKIARRR